MAGINEQPPDLLWHYTSGSGARGIFESRTLWAGHLGYMNDTSEVNLAMNLSLHTVDPLIEEFPHHREALEKWRNYLTDSPPTTWAPNTFAVSFSEERDLLSQWRGYATGAGGPFSIGFPSSLLQERLSPDEGTAWTLRRCIYNAAEQEQLIEDQIRAILIHQDEAVGPSCASTIVNSTWRAIRTRVMSVAPLCKDAGFSEEREWRLVLGPVNPTKLPRVHFVTRQHTLAPYIEFPLADDGSTLDGIHWIAGPGPQQQRANSALGLVARLAEMDGYQGGNSQTPYLP